MRRFVERPAVGACAVFVLAVLAFLPVIHLGFVDYDDDIYVLKNAMVARGLGAESVGWAFSTLFLANYQPLTWLSYLADVSLFGGVSAPGMHATSMLLHALAAALLVPAVASLTQRPIAGVVAGALFAVHPQHVQSVAWLAERKDVLSAVFFALMLWSWSAAHRGARHATWLRVGALVACGSSLLCKPMLVTAPALLLVVDVLLLERPLSVRLVVEKAPFALLAAVVSALTVHAQKVAGAVVGGDEAWSAGERVANAFVVIARYVGQTVWPAGLSPLYTKPHDGWPASLVVAGVVLVVAVTGACVALLVKRGERAPLAGWLWFCGMLVPTIGLVKVGLQAMADRYVYLPHVGLFLVVGVLVDRLARRRAVVAAVLAPAVVAAFAWRTWQEIPAWTNASTLWARAVAVSPESEWVRYYAADAALAAGDVDAALEHTRVAWEIAPERTDIVERRVRALMMVGRFAEAEPLLRPVVAGDPSRDTALLLLGEVCRQTARPDEARALFARAAAAAHARNHMGLEARARAAAAGAPLLDLSEPGP